MERRGMKRRPDVRRLESGENQSAPEAPRLPKDVRRQMTWLGVRSLSEAGGMVVFEGK